LRRCVLGVLMNGTKLLIDTAVNEKSEKVRDLAISELCQKKALEALEYVAKSSRYENTRRYVTLCLYQMKAISSLQRLLEDGPKDVRDYTDILFREMNNKYEETTIDLD